MSSEYLFCAFPPLVLASEEISMFKTLTVYEATRLPFVSSPEQAHS